MKHNLAREKELLVNNLLKVPIVDNCEIVRETEKGFDSRIELDGGVTIPITVYVLRRAFPQQIKEVIEKIGKIQNAQYAIIMAPFISDASAELCNKAEIGYMDYSGNCLFKTNAIYLSEKGNLNHLAEKRKAKTIFDPASVVSSSILRYLMKDVHRPWKLKHLSQEVGCSIGQVSKVKNYLCEQLWAEVSSSGLTISNAEAIMKAWSEEYSVKSENSHLMYTLDAIPFFEKKVQGMKKENGIECYLTGFSGGVRYAPVVRYNRIHLLVRPEDYREFVTASGCKEVENGANVIVYVSASEDILIDNRSIDGYLVASPVQTYLDCMQLKGRGEEMAEAILQKEIR